MTHEHYPDSEADGGPEQDPDLPDATSVPVADGPDDLAPIDWPDQTGADQWTGLRA